MRRLAPFTLLLPLAMTASAAAEEFTVTLSGATYQPDAIAAAVGDTIPFVNDDTTIHAIFVPTAGHATDLGALEPGDEAALPLGKAGTFVVETVVDAGMAMTVEVR